MKKILVLGTGLVSKPGIKYLLEQKNFLVTVASNELEKAQRFTEGYINGIACYINVEDKSALKNLISENDIVVSLLPWIYHPVVAELCLITKKNMVTTSYINPLIREMDEKVKENDLIFLNEIGVDPGIDHISAMKIITEAKNRNEEILHFYSYCGGLPAPQFNNNPFGYKFSWSPKGVIIATRNSAKFLEDGKIIEIHGQNIFENYLIENIEGLGEFEVYPNRNSLPYKEIYGLDKAETIKRGTYRNIGWCETMNAIVKLGLINEDFKFNSSVNSYKNILKNYLGVNSDTELLTKVSEIIGCDIDSKIIRRLIWLGLLSDKIIINANNLLDMLCDLMQEKLYFKEGETDMILMRHRFLIRKSDGSLYRLNSTLIDFGISYGDTSMSRTVSLPLAIGVKLIAEGKITQRGVLIPVHKEIFEPVLQELDFLGIRMIEEKIVL